jgi:hypothetical protein
MQQAKLRAKYEPLLSQPAAAQQEVRGRRAHPPAELPSPSPLHLAPAPFGRSPALPQAEQPQQRAAGFAALGIGGGGGSRAAADPFGVQAAVSPGCAAAVGFCWAGQHPARRPPSRCSARGAG